LPVKGILSDDSGIARLNLLCMLISSPTENQNRWG